MIVGVDGSAAEGLVKQLTGAVGDDLVSVHVGTGSGAGLEDVEREMIVQVTNNNLFRRIHNGERYALVDQAKLAIDLRCMFLDHAKGTQESAGKDDPGNREIISGASRLSAIEGFDRNRHAAHGIGFFAGCRHFLLSFCAFREGLSVIVSGKTSS